MSAPRPRLGQVFGGSSPDRSEGLAGLLRPSKPAADSPSEDAAPASASAPAEERTSTEDDPAAGEPRAQNRAAQPTDRLHSDSDNRSLSPKVPARGRRTARSRPGRPASPNTPGDDLLRLVPVNLDVSVHSVLKDFATRVDRPFATIVLEAIESNADELTQAWLEAAASSAGRLFVGRAAPQQRRRRREPAQQILLRMDSRDADTLDQLVSDWGAPSRSALVTEALRRYLTSNTR